MEETPQTAALEIAPGKNLQAQTVAEDVSELVDRVAIYTEVEQLVRTVDDVESVAFCCNLFQFTWSTTPAVLPVS